MDKEVSGLCFSCHDQTVFQLTGQAPGYDPRKVETDYLEQYVEHGSPEIKCDLCDVVVRYEKQDTGKWNEVLLF